MLKQSVTPPGGETSSTCLLHNFKKVPRYTDFHVFNHYQTAMHN